MCLCLGLIYGFLLLGMKWVLVTMKGGGEGKMVLFKSKMKWIGLLGLVLSAFSLFTHFLLAHYTDHHSTILSPDSITIFSWRPIFDIPPHLSSTNVKISSFFYFSCSFIYIYTHTHSSFSRLNPTVLFISI